MSSIRRMLPYARPHWRLLVATIVIMVLGAASTVAAPWPLKFLVDNVLGDEPLPSALSFLPDTLTSSQYRMLIFAVLAGLFIALLSNGLTVIENYVTTSLDQRMVLDLRSDLFQHAQRLSSLTHDERRTGDFMYRINFASSAVGNITVTIPAMLQNLLTLIGMFVVAVAIDAQVALLSLLVVPFLYYAIGDYARRIQPRLRQVRSMEGMSLSIIHEAMAMLRVIVAFNREGYEHRRFRDQGQSAVDARVDLTVRQTVFSLMVNGITAVGLALVIGVGAHHVIQGELTVGSLLVIVAYIQSLYTPLETISNTTARMQEDLVNLEAAFGLIDTPVDIVEDPDANELEAVHGQVSYQSVSFEYPGRSGTLKNISFEAHAGEMIAIVGPTGAGKSTLVALLSRSFDPAQGCILIDGVDIRSVTLSSLRRNISVVLQEPLLFANTVRNNILYGRLEATDEEIVEAAKSANAHDFIMRMPRKYDSVLGERGARLSGGERQRLAVARAFLKDAPILILDEPTSSIDAKTEVVILDALQRLVQGRTAFMIAHRLSTIRNADRILVMDNGMLVQQGTHDELIDRDGLYRQLLELQLGPVGAHPTPDGYRPGLGPRVGVTGNTANDR